MEPGIEAVILCNYMVAEPIRLQKSVNCTYVEFYQLSPVREIMIESAATKAVRQLGYTTMKLQVVAGILSRRDVIKHLLFSNKSSMLSSPDHFLRANGRLCLTRK